MKQAFTLVELSIVLVILGLLVGGVLAGQNLIRAAEVRSVMTEYANYQTTVMTFRDKYFALPGDMTNATDFWGAMTNCGAASPSGSGTQTCNGDGDSVLSIAGNTSQTGEIFGFWQHLANAGLIEGAYDGIAGAGSSQNSVPGTNSPISKISSATWSTYNLVATASSFVFEQDYGNALIFGGATTSWPHGGVLTADEAWNIDTKLDDGYASRGGLWVIGWDTCTAATNDTDYLDYDLTADGRNCGLVFKNIW